MTMTRTGANAPHKQIEQYIGSAYDTVRAVALELKSIASLAAVIDNNTDFEKMAEVIVNLGDSVSDLASLASADLVAISNDLNKGNYIGNRKIDIDLTLNNSSTTTEVTYKGLSLTTIGGKTIPINFTALDSGGIEIIEELSSFTAIYNALVAGIDFYNDNEPDPQSHVINTEIDIINSTLPDEPTLIRLRDTDGSASSVDRIVLHSYTGSAIEVDPVYYWAKTTSSLQTLANRVGEIISLGNDIDSIIALASQTDELGYMYSVRDKLTEGTNNLYSQLGKLTAVYDLLAEINLVGDNIADVVITADNITDIKAVVTNLALITEVTAKATQVSTDTVTVTQAVATVQSLASEATSQLVRATNKLNEITGVGVANTVTATSGSLASVSYNNLTGMFTFIIPKGLKGDQGEAFQVNTVGALTSRSNFDDQPEGFSFLAIDTSEIYFKKSDTSADWSTGAPFGKGDKGEKGDQGIQGERGFFTAHEWGDGVEAPSTSIRFQNTDGSWSDNWVDVQGVQGIQGVKGDTGDILGYEWGDGINAPVTSIRLQNSDGTWPTEWVDVKGDTGERGERGIDGAQGATGTQLSYEWGNGVNATTSSLRLQNPDLSWPETWIELKGLKGDQGLQGIQGINGDIGATFSVSGSVLTITTP